MKDRMLDGVYEAMVLTDDSPNASNDISHPARVDPVGTMLTFARDVANLPPPR